MVFLALLQGKAKAARHLRSKRVEAVLGMLPWMTTNPEPSGHQQKSWIGGEEAELVAALLARTSSSSTRQSKLPSLLRKMSEDSP